MSDQLAEFLADNRNRAWIATDVFEIYVRHGQRIVDPNRFVPHQDLRLLKRVKTFEIANIKMAIGYAMGQGNLKRYLPVLTQQIQDTGMFDGIFFETVQMLRMQKFLTVQGFVKVAVDDFGQADMYRPFVT